jgi:hypothetical protein
MITDMMWQPITDILKIKNHDHRLLTLKQYLSGFQSYFKLYDIDYAYVATQIYINELNQPTYN